MSKDGPRYSGSLVALEGLSETALETQLRLLPASSQILVLPSIRNYLGTDDALVTPFAPSSSGPSSTSVSALPKSALSTSVAPSTSRLSKSPSTTSTHFDLRRYIKSIHNAAAARQAIALEFLQDNETHTTPSTTSKTPPKKLVFLNGGTVTSHALCIEAIRQHDAAAGGNLEQAALLFDQLTAHGVAGLDETSATPMAAETNQLDNVAIGDDDEYVERDDDDEEGDPATKAMRAADALDRRTEGLQPSTHILDLTVTKKPRPRSLSLPIHGDLLELWDAGRRPSLAPTANTNNTNTTNTTDNDNVDNDDTSTINNRSFYWVPPSMAAGAAGSEIYDANNFSFITSASPTRGSSPTSTIFPVSMRLDAIASQQQKRQPRKSPSPSPARQYVSYRPATKGDTARTVVLDPAPRGRTARRRASQVAALRNNGDNEDNNDDDMPFYTYHHQPPRRRARSLERKPSIGAGSFSGISSISGISGFSRFSGLSGSSNGNGNGLGLNMNFFLSTSSREPSSTRPRRTSNVSDDTTSMATSAIGTKPSISSSSSSKFMPTGTGIPDVPLLPGADVLEKMALRRKTKTKSKQAQTAATSDAQKKPQLRLKTTASVTNVSSPLTSRYVDRGTDASQAGANGASKQIVFELVLPLVEDLVVQFDDDGSNASNSALELAIQRCRELDGAQIIHQRDSSVHDTVISKHILSNGEHHSFDQKTMSSTLPETPKSSSHGQSSSSSPTASASLLLGTATTIPATQATGTFSTDDYDPFAPHEYNAGRKVQLPIAVPIAMQPQAAPSIKTPQPLTPAHTPPPHQRPDGDIDPDLQVGSRFHVLDTAKYQTALALHNALRSILGFHFPEDHESEETNANLDSLTSESLTSFLFSVVPGMEGSSMWAPLLSGNRTEQKVDANMEAETPVTDMVLAFGSQRDVPSSLRAKIMGQLDALTSQPATGISRGGRLDIRYLIANALQSLAAQQARRHGKSTGTVVLAPLIIAQLDQYLRTYPSSSLPASPSVRLVLLEYPMELLPLVLAMQQLAGRDLIQVASVITIEDSKYRTEFRRPFQVLQEPLLSPRLRFSPPVNLGVTQKQPSFKRANFVLTSAANETDIDAFVASIRKLLLLSKASTVTRTATSPAEVMFQNGMIPLTLVAQQQGDAGRYSALSTATTAAGGTGMGIGSSGSSRNSKIRTPPRTDNLMQSPTLPSPLVGNTPSPRRKGSSSEKDRKRAPADSNSGIEARQPPLPLPINTKKVVSSKMSTASISAVRPPKSPTLSMVSQHSLQSQPSSLQSFQSQSDSWRATTNEHSYIAQSTGLAPAPTVLPNSRLVAKTIQVSGSTTMRRAKEQTATVAANPSGISAPVIVNNLKTTSTLPTSSARSDNDNLSNWDAGLDVSEDGNYTYNEPPFATSNGNAKGSSKVIATNGNTAVNSASGASTSVAYGGYNDDEYDSGDDDDDFENDPDMRRLMPLFMRDRAALLAAKEAAGSRGVRPQPMRSKSSQLTGISTPTVSASATMPPTQGPPQVMSMTGDGLRGKSSVGSIHSQHSHASSLANKNSNEGKKALKWLGLA
ncbi:hypothetical protein HMPREF1624_03475 [Sporothrix schenckii ATCC 58251]|uniref:Uncharacterized protein n=1 Tax=Sporothrix schenckii (strain ATCC 58251 / de Perez 2211183) TaxID=1391915 RepID=U7Q063_SPOS1|nr:hypothetical protein HMPREF1624_03475 [Sporothrix schenckii ATCC 58251]